MITETQNKLLGLMKEIDEICERHNIEYFLGGGCLVGAIRNKGFLPWDDDIDIHMTRENAEKFSTYTNEFPQNRQLLKGEETDHPSPIHWRYVDNTSTATYFTLALFDSPGGMYIDIFILDPIRIRGSRIKKIRNSFLLFQHYKAKYSLVSVEYNRHITRRYSFLKKVERFIGFERIIAFYYRKFWTSGEKKANYYIIRTPAALICPKYLWQTAKKTAFEDTYLYIPVHAREILSDVYGAKWYEEPPISARGRHPFLLDREIPYELYNREIAKYIDFEATISGYEKRKNLWFEMYDKKECWDIYAINRKWDIEKKRIADVIQREDISLECLVQNKEIKRIKELFNGYYNLQFEWAMPLQISLEIPETWLWAASIALLYEGSYVVLTRLFESYLRKGGGGRGFNGEFESVRLNELSELVDDMVCIDNSLFVHRDYVEARRLVSKHIAVWSWVINLERAEIALLIHEGAFEKAEKSVREYLRMHPRDGELLKMYGDIINGHTTRNSSNRLYYKALSTIKNGIEKNNIEKKG